MKNENSYDLRFVGLHQDGEHLILATPDGSQHRLAITEMVRAAVRRDRPALEQLKNEETGFLPPREIQAQVRAGLTAEEIASGANISLSQVRRYEGPVLAEREFIAKNARNTKLAQEPGSPTLGEIVTDRLAHRGSDIHSLSWDAYRTEGHGWIIHATFLSDGQTKIAKWSFDQAQNILHALENEARWLSETSISDESIPRRLTAVRSTFDSGALETGVYDVEQDSQQSSTDPVFPDQQTEQLLDQLDARRGQPQEDSADLHEVPEQGYGRLYSMPRQVQDLPMPHDAVVDPPADLPTQAPADIEGADQAIPSTVSGSVGSEPEVDLLTEVFGTADTPDPRPGRKGKKARTRMPSWDEIMFGTKPE